MKKILFCMTDIGVVHAIIWALPYLAKYCEIAVWCDDGMVYAHLYEHFAKTEKLDSKGKMALSKKMALLRPDLVVTSLSAPVENGLEDAAIKASQKLQIHTVGILDKVLYRDECLKKILTQRVLPDFFVVASDMMRLKLQAVLGAFDNVYTLSMPKFAYYAYAQTLNGPFNAALRTLNGVNQGDFPLIFLSSHSEYDKQLVAYLSFVAGKCKNVKILLSFHPKDDEDFIQETMQKLPDAKLLDVGYCSTILALKALTQGGRGAVCSFSSPLLFDVATIGGTAISFIIDRKKSTGEPLAATGLSLLVDSRQQLLTALKNVQSGQYQQKLTGFANEEAINQFVQAMCLLADYD